MRAFRQLLGNHRWATALVVALALSMRLLLPQGFMFGTAEGTRFLTVQLCYDASSVHVARIAIPGKSAPAAPNTPDQHCPYAAMAMGTLGAVAPLLPAPRQAIIPVRALRVAYAVRLGRPANLSPPARGPPATA
jgi:hypothetical protein